MAPDFVSLRELPQFAPELLAKCQTGDLLPIAFEWSKHVGLVAIQLASVSSEQPGLQPRSPLEHGILRGLLNRCSRVMLSTLKLAGGRKHGETIAILGRCVGESAVKVRWLCQHVGADSFRRYAASGLEPDLHLRNLIVANIKARAGSRQRIESRMLHSIDSGFSAAGLQGMDATSLKGIGGLPDFRAMCTALQYDDSFYIVFQRIGSHAVHRTWPDLLAHYLSVEPSGELCLQDNDSPPHVNQLLLPALLVVEALTDYSKFVLVPGATLDGVLSYLADVQRGIVESTSSLRRADSLPDETA
jgi:hypothetical protein